MNHNGPPPAPNPLNVAPPPVPNQHGYGVNNGMISSSIIPKQHSNEGLVWSTAYGKYKNIERTVNRLRVLCHALDIELERRRNGEYEIYGDGDGNNNENDDEDEKEEKSDFYDDEDEKE